MVVKANASVTIADISDAYSAILSSESYTFIGNTTGAPSGLSCSTDITVFCGTELCTKVTIGTITCPNGITAIISNNKTNSPTVTFKTTATVTSACEATIPISTDGITIEKKFSFAVAKTGSTGSAGIGIASSKVTYQVGASQTTTPTGTWQSSVPSTSTTYPYLWTRTILTYTDGSTSTSYSVSSTLDSIEVGGVNLICNTDTFNGWTLSSNVTIEDEVATFASTTSLGWNRIQHQIDDILYSDIRNQNITISLDVRSDEYESLNAQTSKGLMISFALYSANSTTRKRYRDIHFYSTALSNEWKRIVYSFAANDDFFVSVNSSVTDTTITDTDRFAVNIYNYSVYSMQIRHVKIERGTKATDWTLAPVDTDEDISNAQSSATDANNKSDSNEERLSNAESLIAKLEDSIAMLVSDENGMSLMTQTSDGWTFNISSLQDTVNDASDDLNTLKDTLGTTEATIDALKNALGDVSEKTDKIHIGTYINESGEEEPCIELYETDSEFKIIITNTRIMFMNGSDVPTYISNTGLVTQNIEVEETLTFGNWMWKVRDNGNLCLAWKE